MPIDDKMNEIQYARDLQGMFQTVSVAPTFTPKTFFEQIVIYKSGATKRIYIYDHTNSLWSYVALT